MNEIHLRADPRLWMTIRREEFERDGRHHVPSVLEEAANIKGM